jgi:hypothetical protein
MLPTQKYTSTKALLLAVVLVLGMIVSPVCAAQYTTTGEFAVDTSRESFTNVYNISYNAMETGDRINLIQFSVDTGQYVNFTLYYGAGSTVSGSAENHLTGVSLCLGVVPCAVTESTIILNGVSKTYSYGDAQPLFDFNFAGYARDDTNQTGFLAYGSGYGSFDNDLAVFYPVPNIAVNTIYRVDLSGPQTFSVYIDHGKAADISAAASKSALDNIGEWVQLAISIGVFVYGTSIALFYWLKFFFWDNLGMTVALYISISMAYAANTSKDVFKFFGKFLNDQKKMFEFMLSLWTILVNLIATFRGIFRI